MRGGSVNLLMAPSPRGRSVARPPASTLAYPEARCRHRRWHGCRRSRATWPSRPKISRGRQVGLREAPEWRYRLHGQGGGLMNRDPEPESLPDLVDVDRGIVSREIFVDEDVYPQEQQQIFARAWLFVGHESQIPRPGDFLVSSMGEESVILCRDRGGHLHVFLNSCRHRGMKVCRYDEGNTVEFMCPYHGWSYATDGALVGVP